MLLYAQTYCYYQCINAMIAICKLLHDGQTKKGLEFLQGDHGEERLRLRSQEQEDVKGGL